MATLGFGSSKSSSVQSSADANYNLGENISQSGSTQGSNASSYGINASQSGQEIYGAQAPYINDIYANAANLYNNYGMPDKQVAGLNPYLANGLNNQYGFATGTGNDIFTAQLMSSLQNMGGYDTAGMAANRMAGGNVYNAPMTNGLNYATLDASVNNPYLSGQIDAASRDVTRNLYENDMTGNAAAAAATGNSGSSRRAVMDAIAMRSAGDRIGDISAAMRGGAYTTGLGLANQTALANQQARLGTNALNANLMNSGANLAYNMGQAGSTGIADAYKTGISNIGQQQQAGDYLRQYQQQLLDTMYSNQMNPYTGLQMYKSLIGDPTVLSSSSSFGMDGSNSNSFGNSYNNAYSYNMGAGQSASSGTSKSSSMTIGLGTK